MTEIIKEVSSAKNGNAKWGCVPVGPEPSRVWLSYPLTRGCSIRAHADNTVPVHVGYSPEVTADDGLTGGMPIYAREAFTIPVDDLSDLWVVSTVPTKLYFHAV